MVRAKQLATTVSARGHVILPADIRRRRGWSPVTKLTVEDTPAGVLLRPMSPFPPIDPEEVFGSLKCDGPPISVEDLHAAVAAEARRRYDRGRY
jgi:AbrB family looped-hinge helix DNA binding protein